MIRIDLHTVAETYNAKFLRVTPVLIKPSIYRAEKFLMILTWPMVLEAVSTEGLSCWDHMEERASDQTGILQPL